MKKNLLSGLIILLPLAITFWIIKFLIHTLTTPFEQFTDALLEKLNLFANGFLFFSEAQTITILAKIFIIVFLCVVVLIIGLICRTTLSHYFFHLFDRLLRSLPILNTVYGACKDFTDMLFRKDAQSFQKVVLVPYPSEDHKMIGFVTGKMAKPFIENKEQEILSVIVPFTPNISHTMMLFYQENQVTYLDMTVQEAFKFILSCGALVPDQLLIEQRLGETGYRKIPYES